TPGGPMGLRDNNNQPLNPTHTYRFQVIVHDGDQNKGGDSAEGCNTLAGVRAPVQVKVAYADSYHLTAPTANTFPSPWAGAPNTNFYGQGCLAPYGASNGAPPCTNLVSGPSCVANCPIPPGQTCFGFDA